MFLPIQHCIEESILKIFANFHVYHFGDECILKLFANFHVHHYGKECILKPFANFDVRRWPANSDHFTKYLDSDASP